MGIFEKLVELNDKWAQDGMDNQVLDEGSRFYGGIADPNNGIAWPSHGGTPTVMALWAAALIHEGSRFHRDPELLRRLELSTKFMLRFQHMDGTISPPWTNMHSPPDTAFVVGGLSQVHELLTSQDWEALRLVTADIRTFLERTIPALLTGGCHTPNHRWVLTAALGFMYKLTGRPELKARAGQWLAEGIDCTEDGEWTERSNGIYNAVSDIVLIYAAETLGRPDLLEPVRRNLRMMIYMVHPDGEVVTDYSGRQDFGSKYDISSYFLAAKLMAHREQDPQFEALAELAGEALKHPGWLPNNALIGLLRYSELRTGAVAAEPLPDRYEVVVNGVFPRDRYLGGMEAAGHGGRIYHNRLHPDFGAPVARLRRGATSATVITETNSFFALRHGSTRLLAVQVATSFEPGFVRMKTLEALQPGYRLTATERKGYYGPVSETDLPESADGPVSPWYLLPHHLRELTHEQRHDIEVDLAESEDGKGWTICVRCAEPFDLLTQVSFVFGSEGTLEGDGIAPATDRAQFWKQGKVRYTAGDDWMEVDGGAHDHWAKALNNTAYPADCQTLLVNLLTPYDRTFTIRLSGRDGGEGESE